MVIDMKLSRTCLRFLLFLSVCVPTLAQQPAEVLQKPLPETSDVVRIDTELVQTDVMVVDRKDRFVDGLSRDQFQLRIDGKSVPITFFEQVGYRGEQRSGSHSFDAPAKYRFLRPTILHLSPLEP